MGRHKEWRKIAKRERRRRIRTKIAINRDNSLIPNKNCSEYDNWRKEQQAMEVFEYEQIEKANAEENRKWLEAEKIALIQWSKLQAKKELLHQKRLQQEAKLKLELELEQKRKQEEMERLKQLEAENKKRQEVFMSHLQNFLSGGSEEPPQELLVSHETRPDTEMCPFFSKTACCRFGDQCSRNHQYPGISKVLLATNFYVHFGLNNSNYNEYDTDLMLEYEDSDTYKDFKDFFCDVLPEFEKFGRIVQFKVCNNYEKHLRGNTYIEFAELRCAVAAYQSLHSRWYGGRQLSLQFCIIKSWKNAICGLQSKRRCPKGRACNFLHVFRNPNNMFNYFDSARDTHNRRTQTPQRSWRWSESPETEIPRTSKKYAEDRNESCNRKYNARSKYSPHRISSSERRPRRRSSSERRPQRRSSSERRHRKRSSSGRRSRDEKN